MGEQAHGETVISKLEAEKIFPDHTTDTARLNWLSADAINRVESVLNRVGLEGCSVREAIDWLRGQEGE